MRWLLTVLLLLACQQAPAPTVLGPPPAELVMERVLVRQTRNGALTFVAKTPYLEMSRGGDRLFAVDAGIALPGGGVDLEAGALFGSLRSGELEGRGGVELRGRDGLNASSPSVSFARSQGGGGLASSDAGLRVLRRGSTLTASAFTLDLAEQRADFSHPVSTMVPARE
jgi:hypothetical protein